MDEIEVEVVEAEFFHRRVKGSERVVIAMVLDPEFSRDEEVFPRDAALTNGGADALFIVVAAAVSMRR